MPLLYTNLRASTVLQRAGAVLWTAGAAGAVFSHTVIVTRNPQKLRFPF